MESDSYREDTNLYYQQIREKAIKEVFDKSMILIVKIIKASSKELGRVFTINPFGLINDSQNKEIKTRNKNDGITYFGNLSSKDKYDSEKQIDAQIMKIEQEEESLTNSQDDYNIKYGRFFQITFNPQFRQYFIKDSGYGYGTFIKIKNEFIMKDNLAINIGNTYISTKIGLDDNTLMNEGLIYNNSKIPSLPNVDLNSNLTLKIFSANKTNEYYPMNFQPSRSAIKIGRDSCCEVVINDNLISRIHCSIIYKPNIGWVLRDGIYNKEKDGSFTSKSSTNGTWIYASENIPISEGLIFKLKDYNFLCSFSNIQ
ncbi:MAG: FHA domain-containing protein [archaeon]|nr:FHA domain-containing protein [archaeon]